jgi:hypothetical protein
MRTNIPKSTLRAHIGHIGAPDVAPAESEYFAKASAEAAMRAQMVGAAEQQPFFAALGQRLQILSEVIEEAEGALAILRGRVLGPWPHPPGVDAADQLRGAPSLREGTLDAVEALIERARTVADHGQVMNHTL